MKTRCCSPALLALLVFALGRSIYTHAAPPSALDDSYTIAEDTSLLVQSPGLLQNDFDPDGDAISAVLVNGPSHGTAQVGLDGSFLYTPNPDFNGTDTFAYVVVDHPVDQPWLALGPAGVAVRSIAVSPSWPNDPTVVLGSNYQPGRLYRTTDGGDNWHYAEPLGAASFYVHFDAIALSPSFRFGDTDQNIFLGGGNSAWVFRSADAGFSWFRSFAGTSGGGTSTWDFAVSPNYGTDQTFFVAGNNRIHKSTNGGASYTSRSAGLSDPSFLAIEMSPNYSSDQTLFAGGNNYGVFKSINDGISWSAVNSGLLPSFGYQGPSVTALAASPNYAADNTVFAAIRSQGVFRTTDGGATWTRVYAGGGTPQQGLLISPQFETDGVVIACVYQINGTEIVVSRDRGNTWRRMPNPGLPQSSLNCIALSPRFSTDSRVFLGTGDGVWTTTLNPGAAQSNVAFATVTVTPVPDSPVAVADGPFTGLVGFPVTLDASASSDGDGDALTYRWDFGDGSTLLTTAPRIEHTYMVEGTFPVRLVVSDGATESIPFSSQAAIAAAFTSNAGPDDVDNFLTYANPMQNRTALPAGTTSFLVRIAYNSTIQPSSFQATLNGVAFNGFAPAPGGIQSVVIPLASGRNVLSLSVQGTNARGRTSTDRDRLTFIVP